MYRRPASKSCSPSVLIRSGDEYTDRRPASDVLGTGTREDVARRPQDAPSGTSPCARESLVIVGGVSRAAGRSTGRSGTPHCAVKRRSNISPSGEQGSRAAFASCRDVAVVVVWISETLRGKPRTPRDCGERGHDVGGSETGVRPTSGTRRGRVLGLGSIAVRVEHLCIVE
ncbi:hypothetical protein BD626DRAFT_633672 [Schizophyllum amplum]|uniref:Uncharacterized protein n=1 Tax=Schizophyllum amplum TaxID=97359 RepID=A0A550C2A6_9AGAR|nr:hypothetical protein BD626DRAFT_633672 [Auriculariopsis ampla]